MPKLTGAAAVIVDSDGKILLVKHSYGKNNWELPGGKGEDNEPAEETAQREVFEEVGLEVRIEELTGYSKDELPKPISDFTCNRIEHALNPDRKQLFRTVGP